jgi:hypothetical protein
VVRFYDHRLSHENSLAEGCVTKVHHFRCSQSTHPRSGPEVFDVRRSKQHGAASGCWERADSFRMQGPYRSTLGEFHLVEGGLQEQPPQAAGGCEAMASVECVTIRKWLKLRFSLLTAGNISSIPIPSSLTSNPGPVKHYLQSGQRLHELRIVRRRPPNR